MLLSSDQERLSDAFLTALWQTLAEVRGVEALTLLAEFLQEQLGAAGVRLGVLRGNTVKESLVWIEKKESGLPQPFRFVPETADALRRGAVLQLSPSETGFPQDIMAWRLKPAHWVAVATPVFNGAYAVLELFFAEPPRWPDLAFWLRQAVARAAQEVRVWQLDQAHQSLQEKTALWINYDTTWQFWLLPDGRFEFLSPAIKRYTGQPPASFLQTPARLLDFIHPDDRDKYTRHLAEDLPLERPADFNFRVRHADGSEFWLRHICQPIYDESAVYRGRRGVNLDITAHKAQEEKLSRRLRGLEVLYVLTQKFTFGISAREYAREVLAVLAQYLHWHHAVFRTYDAGRDRFQVLAFNGLPDEPSALAHLNKTIRTQADGATGWCVRSGKPLRINYLRQDERYIETYQRMGSGIYVPLKQSGQIIGAISVESEREGAFSSYDLDLLEIIANHVASVLENIHLLEQVQEQVDELTALYDATRRLSSSRMEPEQVYQTLQAGIRRLMPFDALVIGLAEPELKKIRVPYLWEDGQRYPEQMVPYDAGLVGRVLRQRKTLLFRDYSRSRQMRSGQYVYGAEDKIVRSVLAVPLAFGGQVNGAVVVQSYQRGLYGQREKRLLENLAAQAGVALENALLFDRLRQHTQELEAILAVMRLLTEPLSEALTPLLPQIIENAVQAIPDAEKGALLLLTEDGDLRIQAATGYHDKRLFEQDFSEQSGYVGETYRTGQPVLAQHAPERYPLPYDGRLEEANQIQSGIAAPLRLGEKVIGVISLDNASDPDAFSAHDLSLLETFAHTAALVIERTRSWQTAVRRLRQLEAMAQVSAAIGQAADSTGILQLTTLQLQEIFSAEEVAVLRLDEQGQNLVLAFQAGNVRLEIGETVPLPPEHPVRNLFNARQPGIWQRLDEILSPDFIKAKGLSPDYRLALLPLQVDARELGLVALMRRQAFSGDERAILLSLTDMVANALARSRLLSETRRYAEKMATISQLGRALAETQDLPALYQRLLQFVTDLFPMVRFSALWLTPPRHEVPYLAACQPERKQPLVYRELNCPLMETCSYCHQPVHTDVMLYDNLRPLQSALEACAQGESLDSSLPDGGWLACIGLGNLENEYGRGLMQIVLSNAEDLSDQDKDLLLTIASIASVEIANTEYLRAVHEQAERWAYVARMARLLAVSVDEGQVYQHIYQGFKDLFACENLSYLELDRESGVFKRVFAVKDDQAMMTDLTTYLQFLPEGAEAVSPSQAVVQESLVWEARLSDSLDETILYAPVFSAGEARGVLAMTWPEKRYISAEDQRLVEMIANQMGVTLRKLALMQEQRYRISQLQALRTIDMAITSSTDLELTLNVLLDEARHLLGVDIASVILYDQEAYSLEVAAVRGQMQATYNDLHLLETQSLPWQVLIQREPIFLPTLDTQSLSPVYAQRLQAEFVQAAALLPLVAKGELQGLLELYVREPKEFPDDWREFAIALAGQAAIAIDNHRLFESLQESNNELRAAYDATIEGWALALEMRDRETEGHTRRVTELAVALARHMGLPEEEIVHIRRGALLHDIGKIGVPDAILHKPGKLSDEEWQIMKKHPEFAYNFLRNIEYLRPALDIPYSHHERWDGTGYPLGLRGEEIPLAARIFAVADVYDALATDRPYRKAWPRDKVLAYIKEQSGSHFDPNVVRHFLEMMQAEDWAA